jgi:hypothetical protein
MRPTHLDMPREVPRDAAKNDTLSAAGHDDGSSLLQGAVNDRNAAVEIAREAVAKASAAEADAAAARADCETMARGREAAEVECAAARAAYDDMAAKYADAVEKARVAETEHNAAIAAKDDEIARLGDELKLAQEELASAKETKDAPSKKSGKAGSSD